MTRGNARGLTAPARDTPRSQEHAREALPAGAHVHHCPRCYERPLCWLDCHIERDLSAERPTGHAVVCDACMTPAERIEDAVAGITSPAEAVEVLRTRGLWPWSPGDAAAPRWWCATYGEPTRSIASSSPEGRALMRSIAGIDAALAMPPTTLTVGLDLAGACPTCDGPGHTADPPSLPALVAVASLGAERLATAVQLCGEIARGPVTVVLRVMERADLNVALERACDPTLDRAGDVPIGYIVAHEAFGRIDSPLRYSSEREWPERFPWLGVPGDHPARIAWPALRALALDCGVALIALDAGRAVLAVEAIGSAT